MRCVALIRGLVRRDRFIVVMQKIFQLQGYEVLVTHYPSTKADLFSLAEQTQPQPFTPTKMKPFMSLLI